MHRNEHVDRFTIVQLTGKKQVVDDKTYWETAEGWWMRAMDGTVTNPGPPPRNLAPGEKWIDVNLGLESLVAFEGDKPVFATIISSGRHDDDPAKDHRTRPGEFRVREKHISATMDNDTATDGPYSIEDVPWIMYFDGSTALHGAFWHSRFGHERSHGCVNMTPHDAHELFGWVGPKLPDGWHGVRATDANPGTRVIVHDNGKTAEESKKDDDTRRQGPGARRTSRLGETRHRIAVLSASRSGFCACYARARRHVPFADRPDDDAAEPLRLHPGPLGGERRRVLVGHVRALLRVARRQREVGDLRGRS